MPAKWELPAGIPKLAHGEVQVWRIDLPEGEEDDTAYLPVLSSEERNRAARLRAGHVRLQFLVGRSCVRTLLGAHLAIAPSEVPITSAEYGKPELASPYAERVHFNVAHSRSTVLVALSLTGPLGIDIEYLDRKTDVAEVARHSLTERETADMMAIDDTSARASFFFERWTKKEAVVKADGKGLSLPLTSFEAPEESLSRPAAVTISGQDRTSHRTYFVSDIAIVEGAACAIATADRPLSLRLLKFLPTNLAT